MMPTRRGTDPSKVHPRDCSCGNCQTYNEMLADENRRHGGASSRSPQEAKSDPSTRQIEAIVHPSMAALLLVESVVDGTLEQERADDREAFDEAAREALDWLRRFSRALASSHAVGEPDWRERALKAEAWIERFAHEGQCNVPEHQSGTVTLRIRSLLEAIRDNDPNDMASDAVTVGEVWRKEAEDILTAAQSRPSTEGSK